ncbi:SRPBCC family protein [Nocardia altamirensis]|uniref:SRPBCC family protein n=1 Tax=Nocardia altamirensis TaxID=472158 RepID=UPI00083FED56|nr:SRPBCC family protein [Nocardia altamirensis]
MTTGSYTLDTVIPAPRKIVYGIFADRERYGEFLPIHTRLQVAGSTERQGIGAVHFLGRGPIGVKERITDLVADERIDYELLTKGLPVDRHFGTILFSDHPNGTRVAYTMDSTPSLPMPRPLLVLGLRLAISTLVSGARRQAVRAAKASV